MTKIALFGAGGKMGYRLAKNLKGSRFARCAMSR
ncbi:dihydrodipicolinate reductase [Rhizobium leguminosarum]